MRELSSTSWRRRGSSVVFDREALAPLIGGEAWMVSLRTALGWLDAFPTEPPAQATILVTGLEAALETQAPAAAEALLERRVARLIERVQSQWDRCGLVFGFAAPANAFETTGVREEVLFRVQGRRQVRLSFGLWDGSATVNLARLYADRPAGPVAIGFHVARVS